MLAHGGQHEPEEPAIAAGGAGLEQFEEQLTPALLS